jgi:uncharacterized protein (DUF433 family)
MIALPETLTLPMNMDEHGTIRISSTRVTLDTVIGRYHQGDSPEVIHAGFDVVPLTDIYAVIAYYLAHQDEVDAYLRQGEEEAAHIREKIEATYTPEQKARHEKLRALAAKKRRERESDN